MTITRSFFLLLIVLVPLQGFADQVADFSGNWKMIPAKGENLGMAAAVDETLVVAQTVDTLVIDFTDVFQGNTTTRQVTYDLGEKPMTNFAAMGDKSETVSKWDGDKLVTTWTSEGAIAGTQSVRTETRWLSNGGATMHVKTERSNRPAMVMVYDRQ